MDSIILTGDNTGEIVSIKLSLNYPDIAIVVSLMSQRMHYSPKNKHLDATCKILSYLKGTPYQGLFFKNNNSRLVEVYTNANWTDHQKTSTSTLDISHLCWET